MNARDFCYWLQGYSEIDGEKPTQNKWVTILDHIKEVEEIKAIQARIEAKQMNQLAEIGTGFFLTGFVNPPKYEEEEITFCVSGSSGLAAPIMKRGSITYC